MVSLQRYTKALSSQQRATLVEKSRQKPQERMRVVTDAVKNNRYDDDPILSSCGIKIEKQLTRVDGRVLSAPTVRPHPFILFSPFICDSCSLIILIC
jgi:eukaryotic translation initiation factor 2C